MKHKIRALIYNEYTREAKKYIDRGDLSSYTTDESYIYKTLTQAEYEKAIREGNNEPFRMEELGLAAEYCYKP